MTEQNKKKSGLPYDRGNAGDLIKHGALAHFVKWWCEKHPAKSGFRFADPFGGIPREPVNDAIKDRLSVLREGDPYVAKCLLDGGDYLNSGLIVAKAVEERGKKPEVWTSDRCLEMREKLQAEPSLRMLDTDLTGNYDNQNGYSILPHAGDFDLVLIDPFKEFLSCEAELGFPTLTKIKEIVESPAGRNTCIAVFIVAKRRDFKQYNRFKKNLNNIALSLRCPKVKGSNIRGEKSKTEMLLISAMFANGGGRELRERLGQFRNVVQEILPVNITMWAE